MAIGIKKLCRANVPGLVFVLIASPCWQLVSMLCGPCIGIRPGIHRGAGTGICSHLFSRCPSCWHLHGRASCWCSRTHPLCWCSRMHPLCWCLRGCLSCGRLRGHLSCCCWHSRGCLFCCRAGVCTGVHHAAIRAGICRVCWCRVLVLRGWRHH